MMGSLASVAERHRGRNRLGCAPLRLRIEPTSGPLVATRARPTSLSQRRSIVGTSSLLVPHLGRGDTLAACPYGSYRSSTRQVLRHLTPLLLASLLALASVSAFTINLGNAPPSYKGVVAVKDKDATGGVAYKTTKGIGGVIHFGYTYNTYMGVYEASFRLKVADNTVEGAVGRIRYNCETERLANVPADLTGSRGVRGTDFKEAGKYQEFTVRWIGPHKGRMGWAAYTTGAAELWIDAITVRKIRSLTETQLLDYLPGAKTPPIPTPRTGPLRAHFIRGFFSDYFLLDLALPQIAGLRVTSSSFSTGGGCAGQPGNPKALYDHDLLIMAGTNITHLSIPQRVALKTWIESGGGLFVLGGPVSFSQAGMSQSAVAEVLPVILSKGFDLRPDKSALAPHPSLKAHPIIDGLDLTRPMVTLFRHQLSAKEGATIVLGTDERPLLVVGDYGKGRVACFLAAPMGREEGAEEGETVFWNDPRLPALFRNVTRYLITRKPPEDAFGWQPDAAASKAVLQIIETLEDPEDDDPLDDPDDADLGGDPTSLATAGAEGPGKPPNLSKEQIELLIREGGRPGVSLLLRSMPLMTEKGQVRRIEWAVRPFIDKEHYADLTRLYKGLSPISGSIRESTLSLMGKSDPGRVHPDLVRHLRGPDPRLKRAAARSAYEGRLRKLIPTLKKVHAELKPEVERRRLARYEGYWFRGIRPDDPIWAYTECTMALLSMGEKGYARDACDLMFLLHLQHIKIRSFIFLYNLKVPREAKLAERHHKDNAFSRPDLERLLVRFRIVLSTLPKPLHAEFREALLGFDDSEALVRLLCPAYDLIQANGTPEWLAFEKQLGEHAFKAALAAERF